MANLFRCGSGGGIKSITIPKIEIICGYVLNGVTDMRMVGLYSNSYFYIPDEAKRITVGGVTPTNKTVGLYGIPKGSTQAQLIVGLNNTDISNYTGVYFKVTDDDMYSTYSHESKVTLTNITLEF